MLKYAHVTASTSRVYTEVPAPICPGIVATMPTSEGSQHTALVGDS